MQLAGERASGLIAAAVVVVSIATAVTGLMAAQSSVRASDLDHQTVQLVALGQEQRLGVRGEVAADLRLLPRVREHVGLAHLLGRDADRARADAPRLSRALVDRALAERSQARALARHLIFPAFVSQRPDGGLGYDPTEVLQAAERETALWGDGTGDPAEVQRSARDAHDRTVALVATTAVLVLALVFLTLARVTEKGWRAGFAAAAAAVLVAPPVVLLTAPQVLA